MALLPLLLGNIDANQFLRQVFQPMPVRIGADQAAGERKHARRTAPAMRAQRADMHRKAIAGMQIQPGDTILDMGCGTGRNALLMKKYLGEKGEITGMDISAEMETQFLRKFGSDENVRFINQRIDVDFDLGKTFDKVFISFVIHGFPHEVRKIVIKNA